MYTKFVLGPYETRKETLVAPGARREVTSVPRRIDVSSAAAPIHVQFSVHHDDEVIAGYTLQQPFPLFWPVPVRHRMVDIDVTVRSLTNESAEVEVNDLHNVTEQVLLAQPNEVEKILEKRSTIPPLQERYR